MSNTHFHLSAKIMSVLIHKEPIIRNNTLSLGPFTKSQLTVHRARVNPIEKLKLGHGFEDSTLYLPHGRNMLRAAFHFFV